MLRSLPCLRCWVLFVILSSVLAPASLLAAPPAVVKSVPANGAADVDPGLRAISVTFDQDMSPGGFSWVGGGPSFPQTTGRPRWTDARTCVLPVRLEASHDYQLGINSVSFTNFRSASGEPATPYPIAFRTAAGSGQPAAAKMTVKDNAAAIDALRKAIDQDYAYRDLRKLDWDALFQQHKPKLLTCASPGEFAAEAALLLADAKDPHIWLQAGGPAIGTFHREVAPNWNMDTLAKSVPGWQKRSDAVYTGRFPDGIGYIMIANWDQDSILDLEPAFEALDDFSTAPGLIVDVRPNAGGSETLAQFFAGCFVDAPVTYGRDAVRQAGALGPQQERVLQPKKGRPRYRGKVAVLTGPAVMSSCESFLLMMKQVHGCTLVGARSYGSSGNPKAHDLGNGVTVYLPSWVDMLPDGTPFEGQGIEPNVKVEATPQDSSAGDPVLDAALHALRGQ